MSVYAAQLGFAQAHPLCQWSLWQIKQAEKIPNLFQPSEVISQLIHGLQLQTNWTLSLCALKFKDHLPLCGSKNVYLVIAPCAECIVSVELIKMIKYSWAPYRAPFFFCLRKSHKSLVITCLKLQYHDGWLCCFLIQCMCFSIYENVPAVKVKVTAVWQSGACMTFDQSKIK